MEGKREKRPAGIRAEKLEPGGEEGLELSDETAAELGAIAKAARGGAGGLRAAALFVGGDRLGKEGAARALGARLGRDVYRIDLASVVNKYIGETEKRLDAAFAAAESADVVLLLDEGDALLAARTEVKDAHDRYANLEVNYLLDRIEGFEGLVILSTELEPPEESRLRRLRRLSFPEPGPARGD